jgi:integrase
MRVGEAIALDRDDVNLTQALLTVRQAKGNKSRLVPLHPSTRDVLRRYECLRDRICPNPRTSSFFISQRGTRLLDCTVRYWFIRISHQIGLRGPHDHRGPRLHDLRHRFAIRTLERWYRMDKDIEVHLPELATYLGHGHVTDTYWYLSATPELLRLATRRCERTREEGDVLS